MDKRLLAKYVSSAAVALSLTFSPSIVDSRSRKARKSYLYKLKSSGKEKLTQVSEKTGVSLDQLKICNPDLSDEKKIRRGTRVKLYDFYAVHGEHVDIGDVATRTNVSVEDLINHNPRTSMKYLPFILDEEEKFVHKGEIFYVPCREKNQVSYNEKMPRWKRAQKGYVRFRTGLELKIIADKTLVGTSVCEGESDSWVKLQVLLYRSQKDIFSEEEGEECLHSLDSMQKRYDSLNQRCEFYDINETDNPLLEVPVDSLNKKISRCLTVGEVTRIHDKDLQDANLQYIQKVDGKSYYKYARIDLNLLRKLDTLCYVNHQKLEPDEIFRSFGQNLRNYFRTCGGRLDMYVSKRNEQGRETSKWKIKGFLNRCIKTGSRHPSGQAADLFPNDLNRRNASRVFSENGFGSYPGGTTHVDVREGPVCWPGWTAGCSHFYRRFRHKKK